MTRFARSPGVVQRRVAGEMVLVAVAPPGGGAGDFFVLNETAAAIWEHLDRPRSEGEVARYLIEKFEIDEAEAVSDVRTFLEDMRRHAVITDHGQ
ncbi:MAG TPA: PqqD family protein [Gemmatimonadaceae bacterium]|nr:PqqD family protein [Gemmatimonadaceae bacterium]